MSYESNIATSGNFFAGTDVSLSYEVFAADGVTMEDVSGFSLQWELRPIVVGKNPHRAQGASLIMKTTAGGAGITISGTYNAARETNTQRVIVALSDTDTEALEGGRYVCALKRMDSGLETVLSHGTVELLVSSVR
jgi:hypothetical protein